MTTTVARIKLVDDIGKTVCAFVKFVVDEQWGDEWLSEPFPGRIDNSMAAWRIEGKPLSRRARQRSDAILASGGTDIYSPRPPVRAIPTDDGYRWVLELPGLTLRWERVMPVLESLAERTDTLTVTQLRALAQRS
ncbi:hypothetical protein [Mycobacterium gordonae]|uniref:Uncharacterized protein n=1 Tax=Mycobacterium gordonae TaxID=1778 RepID=A0A1X1X9A2_MYCGO|nr:hypothetical protein [Mycobacterium gordonae]MCV7005666.1 hypothetical protein [Mycobacterium gordonae]ODR23500.1 hypothetical protein BHQ23_04555 [Mycobacterium gordonae]ORV95230.1 hypothetical protein AWC08_15375 [Mycobacterium gordonae]